MSTWKQAKLYGGELDGAEFELDYDPPPEFLFVLPLCENCGCYHHVPADALAARLRVPSEAVTYKLKRIDKQARVAHYGHADLNDSSPPGETAKVEERDLVGV
jgi:hypothetical protein